MSFVDRFTAQASQYAAQRPTYPEPMIAALAALAPRRALAWDVGTGNGQAAVLLASHFERVVATDASAGQLAHARPMPNVEYRQRPAEESGVATATVDLVTVAQALHWFDLPRFYAEVDRVLVPDGLLAAWTYGLTSITPGIDDVVGRFYRERIGRYWAAERRHVEDGYASLPFPYPEMSVGSWEIVRSLDRAGWLAYVETWSALVKCRDEEGVDPLPELDSALERVWPDGLRYEVRWPISIRTGRRGA